MCLLVVRSVAHAVMFSDIIPIMAFTFIELYIHPRRHNSASTLENKS